MVSSATDTPVSASISTPVFPSQETVARISTAALTVYDMCKAVQKDMVITDVRLLDKTGGVHGDFHREEDKR